MKYLRILIAAVTATAAMTAFMLLAPLLHLGSMDMGVMLGAALGGVKALGWVAHFVIGFVFAFIYVEVFNGIMPVENNFFRGVIYGIGVFIVSEIIYTVINLAGFYDAHNTENMAVIVFATALACMIYGGVLGLFFDKSFMKSIVVD